MFSKKVFSLLMVFLLVLTMGLFSCSDDDSVADAPFSSGISGTIDFPADCEPNAKLSVGAWEKEKGPYLGNMASARFYHLVLSEAVDTAQFELRLPPGEYYAGAAVYKSGSGMVPDKENGDFAGTYGGAFPNAGTIIVVEPDKITENIDMTLTDDFSF